MRLIRIENIHKKISFLEIYQIMEVFGDIEGFLATDDSFLFQYSVTRHDVLLLDGLSLGGRRVKVGWTSYQGDLDHFVDGVVLLFPGREYEVEDIKNECIRYGSVEEVSKKDGGVIVVCSTPGEYKNIFYWMYGKYYNGRRIRCIPLVR